MLTVLLIGIGLAMDAFSVSVTNGMCIKRLRLKDAGMIALVYAVFQFLMPLTGFFAASVFKGYIEKIDHWVAFVLLFFIGLKMIVEAFDKKEESCENSPSNIGFKMLIIQGIATSIDALAVGVSFAALKTPIISSALLIGAVTFLICFAGVYVGKKAGGIFKNKAEIAGGVILIAIGIKILVEHLFF